jgi:hypothetical protein
VYAWAKLDPRSDRYAPPVRDPPRSVRPHFHTQSFCTNKDDTEERPKRQTNEPNHTAERSGGTHVVW